MLEINLLPKEAKDKILSKKTSSFFNSMIIPSIILIILIAGLLVYLYWDFSQANKLLDSQIATTKTERDKYSTTLTQVNQYNRVLDLVKQLTQYKTDWPKILSELASLTPEKVQINKFDFSTGTASSKKAALISGFSSSYQNLILFKQKLDNSKEFKNATINTATTDDKGIINFDMTVELRNIKITIQSSQQSKEGEK